ncbi:MAG: type II toxin-antitoxin system RelE/ParE family toxin [Actinobacteria bacterium]|nr:type II toxin-antitoxin system RelE/ParE family toxin [Actinomycetota bacterium]MCG2818012.1 type II toxin-antitoxin system RelE/ParE family toxin [Actinomycetes bacterium]MBU4218457.1 type II toxin-antitoxin system RelE/ParE family toxin [Actinomycetota bacterium]MBU4358218.1 type II toxin-antitoxin system RelE/ParE family toxin [Actinomycetota bacterium]MBU4391359.1 type II toxin-antitoxin system RelE/ParE family toxin [Actinomycetota bacterium]
MKQSSSKHVLRFSRAAEKTLRQLQGKDKSLVVEALRILEDDPMNPRFAVKLRGDWGGYFRIRKGNWRIVYRTEKDTVNVMYIRRRKEDTYRV